MEGLIKYLEERHPAVSVRKYVYDIGNYQQEIPNHETANYLDLMRYVGQLRRENKHPRTIKTMLHSIKKYYQYLVDTGERKDHPCRMIRLRDARKKQIQIQDLFTTEELENLREQRTERYEELKTKNQVIISLLIYQALTTKEITRLKLSDIDLQKAEVYIRSSAKLNSRIIKLHPQQILLFHQYLIVDRVYLLNKAMARAYAIDEEAFILTRNGTAEEGQTVHKVITSLSHLYPGRKLSPMTIRQSVIANKIKQGHNIRAVQIFAGHKDLSTTEIYRQTSVEELKVEVLKYHPLK